MHAAAVLCLCLDALPAAAETPANLDFAQGTLAAWEGAGFSVTSSRADDALRARAVSSGAPSDLGRTALLHRALVIPAGTGVIRFRACALRPPNSPADGRLDVLLLAAGKRIIPKQVRTGPEWQTAPTLLPPENGQPREYIWRVADYAGQTLRIALLDDDDRPGCFLSCSGFEVLGTGEFESAEFTQFMIGLTEKHQLAPLTRYESRHFLALSNAEDAFSEERLRECELLYTVFFDHFRRKGFVCREPEAKLMVAIFDTQAGFEGYLGQKVPPFVAGIFHPASNRLVMYDFGQNEKYLAQKRQAEQQARRLQSYIDRQRYLGDVQRQARDFRAVANIATITHEAAHQLSFNCGFLNRHADLQLWLAEGLACYCEATANGAWQGVGEPNPERLAALAAAVRGDGRFLKLRGLIESNSWGSRKLDQKAILLGYGQSWALFRMLMEEQPQALRAYLTLIYDRHIPDRRLADFQTAFGTDLDRLERRHIDYIRRLVAQYVPVQPVPPGH